MAIQIRVLRRCFSEADWAILSADDDFLNAMSSAESADDLEWLVDWACQSLRQCNSRVKSAQADAAPH